MTTLKLVLLALLTAIQVYLGNVFQFASIGKQFNFGFLPIAVAAAMMGPGSAAIVAGLGDFIGATMFPAGAYFPGFTFTAVIVGILYALPLYNMPSNKRSVYWTRAAIAAVLGTLPNLFLNSLWLSILYSSKTYWMWVVSRAASYLIEIPIQVVVISAVLHALGKFRFPTFIRLPRKEKVEKV